eukprot:1653914-Prymnesium_polylepis.1
MPRSKTSTSPRSSIQSLSRSTPATNATNFSLDGFDWKDSVTMVSCSSFQVNPPYAKKLGSLERPAEYQSVLIASLRSAASL